MHLAKDVLSQLKASLPTESCPEVTPSLASIMSIICLAEAQVPFLSAIIYSQSTAYSLTMRNLHNSCAWDDQVVCMKLYLSVPALISKN
jgi:hypothetical protein